MRHRSGKRRRFMRIFKSLLVGIVLAMLAAVLGTFIELAFALSSDHWSRSLAKAVSAPSRGIRILRTTRYWICRWVLLAIPARSAQAIGRGSSA